MLSDDREQQSSTDEALRFRANAPDDLLPKLLRRLGLEQQTQSDELEDQPEQLLESLHSADWSLRVAALQKLSKPGRRIRLQPVVEALQDEQADVRTAAVRALGTMGERIPVTSLQAALHDSAWTVREAAVRTLAQSGGRIPLAQLTDILHSDADESVRAAAAQTLGTMKERAGIVALVEATRDPAWVVREAAVMALGELGPPLPAAPLKAALDDVDMSVRMVAQEVLYQTHPELISASIAEEPDEVPQTESSHEDQQPEPAARSTENVHDQLIQPTDQHVPTTTQKNFSAIFDTMPLSPATERRAQPRVQPVPQHEPEATDRITYLPLPVDIARRSGQRGTGRHPVTRWLTAGISGLVAASLIIASLLIFHTLRPTTTGSNNGLCPANMATGTVGCAYFADSIQPSSMQNNGQGINDELSIVLSNVPNPPTGKSYYAWLLSDAGSPEAAAILLGKLSVQHGNIRFTYQDPQHMNLLAQASAFLITVEDNSVPPVTPSLEAGAKRYAAQFSTVAVRDAENNNYSLLDHLRHLLASDPKLQTLGLQGGLDGWLLRNTNDLVQWAKAAKAAETKNDTQSVHNLLVKMLYYLDGNQYVQTDVPAGTPLSTDPAAKVALLSIGGLNQNPPGYLSHIDYHLTAIVANPYATAYQKALAVQIQSSINIANADLVQVHNIARTLVQMNHTQLLQQAARVQLDDLVTSVEYAYNGRTGSNGQTQAGVVKIYKDIQDLAVFEVQPQ